MVAIAMDDDGLRVDALAERLADGLRPKFLYTIPEYQNPTGRTLPLERRRELVELCRRHGVLIFEDVAYRELPFDGTSLPSLWSLGAGRRAAGGHVLQELLPRRAARLGGGPAEVVAELAAAKQNTDQCAGGLGQRLLEEYGRAGGFERHLPAARALYASRWAALSAALTRHMPEDGRLDRADGRLSHLAHAAGGARHARHAPGRHRGGRGVRPGPPFHVGDGGRNTLRLSFSHLTETELETAVERLAAVIRSAHGGAEVVGASGLQARPLGDRAAVDAESVSPSAPQRCGQPAGESSHGSWRP